MDGKSRNTIAILYIFTSRLDMNIYLTNDISIRAAHKNYSTITNIDVGCSLSLPHFITNVKQRTFKSMCDEPKRRKNCDVIGIRGEKKNKKNHCTG